MSFREHIVCSRVAPWQAAWGNGCEREAYRQQDRERYWCCHDWGIREDPHRDNPAESQHDGDPSDDVLPRTVRFNEGFHKGQQAGNHDDRNKEQRPADVRVGVPVERLGARRVIGRRHGAQLECRTDEMVDVPPC